MKYSKQKTVIIGKWSILFSLILGARGAYGEPITHGSTTVNMDFVYIEHKENQADTSGYGAVVHDYRIGKFEVTAAQWEMVRAADSRIGNAGSWSGSQPTAAASWHEAAKFCNWLTSGDAYNGAYNYNSSGILISIDRDAAASSYGTVYVIPTEDEWYKAAYLKSDGSGYTLYATGDTIPVAGVGGVNYNKVIGSPWTVGSGTATSIENNGTFDMNGNLWEWIDGAWDGNLNDMYETRLVRGGSYANDDVSKLSSSNRNILDDIQQFNDIGFRVVSIALPDTDGDGLVDRDEINIYGTDPEDPDSDNDGLTDGQEVNTYNSNPKKADSDDDGFDDGFEVSTGFSPTSSASTPDLQSEILTAIEFQFNAASNISYRIEAAHNLTNTWEIVEADIIGQGGEVKRLYSVEGQDKRYFRARRN